MTKTTKVEIEFIGFLCRKAISLEEENDRLREALSESCDEYKKDHVPRCYARREDENGHCIAAKEGCYIYKILKGGEEC